MKSQITFWGGVGAVTGANFLFEWGGQADASGAVTGRKKILVDCGLLQGEKTAPAENRGHFPYDPATIDCLFVTHAHLDHVGKIPKLVRNGFKGVIYSTPETRALAQLILEDAVHLIQREAREDGLPPLYEQRDIDAAMMLWKEIPYRTPRLVFPGNIGANSSVAEMSTGLTVTLRDAGHVLGSSMIEFSFMEMSAVATASAEKGASDAKPPKPATPTKVVFTGDLGNSPTPILEDTEKLTDTDYLVMESVYGDRNHEPAEERKKKFAQVINDTVGRGGTLVIPAFSLERTQVILFELNELMESKQVPQVPVFADSPLANKITEIYRRSSSSKFFNAGAQAEIAHGDQPFNFPGLQYTMSGQDSAAIDHTAGSKIIIAGSGMSTGGRVTRHEAIFLPDEKSTILLVGYQALGTLGRELQDGAKSVRISPDGRTSPSEISVRAHIETIFGFSSHKDSDHLVEFVENTAPTLRRVFVVMGEPKASLFLVQKLRDNLGVNALMPERGKPYILG